MMPSELFERFTTWQKTGNKITPKRQDVTDEMYFMFIDSI